ncbi:MAG TPA: type II toxin-antitoxin system VapC family toxin [Leucothrix sp.]|nr:type II toxin-antitoxin system VapC family toxin [Leucothrix sp.]
MILVDTSVWIDHFREADNQLTQLLIDGLVLMHPAIIGELACGNLQKRQQILLLLDNMPKAKQASDDEVLYFIEQNQLMGKGIGYIDAQLLASTALTHATQLLTRDKRLGKSAKNLGLDASFLVN